MNDVFATVADLTPEQNYRLAPNLVISYLCSDNVTFSVLQREDIILEFNFYTHIYRRGRCLNICD